MKGKLFFCSKSAETILDQLTMDTVTINSYYPTSKSSVQALCHNRPVLGLVSDETVETSKSECEILI